MTKEELQGRFEEETGRILFEDNIINHDYYARWLESVVINGFKDVPGVDKAATPSIKDLHPPGETTKFTYKRYEMHITNTDAMDELYRYVEQTNSEFIHCYSHLHKYAPFSVASLVYLIKTPKK